MLTWGGVGCQLPGNLNCRKFSLVNHISFISLFISRLLLRILGKYVDFVWTSTENEWKCAEHNLITCVWTFYHSWSDHERFDQLSSETYEKHSVFSKSVLTIDRCRPHSVTFGYCGWQEEPAVQISWLLLHLRVVWTSIKNEWNVQNAVWTRVSRPSTPRKLITRVLTICHVKT